MAAVYDVVCLAHILQLMPCLVGTGFQVYHRTKEPFMTDKFCGGGSRPRSPPRRESRPPPPPPAPQHHPTIVLAPAPRRSILGEAAAIAGGVAVGTTMGHVAADMLTGRRREEVERQLPPDQRLGAEPTGPCAPQINDFLSCAVNNENLQECSTYNEALKECKKRNGIP